MAANILVIETYPAKDGYRWRAKRGGRIVADSGEAYSRPRDAERAAQRLASAISCGKFECRAAAKR